MASVKPQHILNFNVGVLGHVDCGKTSLCKALSSVASTACFDKNPQSKERGITLDLGFSSFMIDLPDHMKSNAKEIEALQFTLVDCPGHASLIKTIIGGAQIVDLMMLVIDTTKGMQTQTAECLVIGEITCDKMIAVLNKIDQIPIDTRDSTIAKVTKRMQLTLQKTKFSSCPIIPVSALGDSPDFKPIALDNLKDVLAKTAFIPLRKPTGSFILAVDHCFPIKGQGTVLTGTVLQGKVSVNENLEIPSLKINRKVKSIQIFRQPVESAVQGDRVGICVTQFDSQLLERGIACTPGTLPPVFGFIARIEKIIHFKHPIKNKMKFHLTCGHETVMGKLHLFKSTTSEFVMEKSYSKCDELDDEKDIHFFGLFELDHSVTTIPNGLFIGSKFDTDIHSNTCRIAFKGAILYSFLTEDYMRTEVSRLKVYKSKQREGVVERMVNAYEVIGKNLWKKETNITPFLNLKVTLSTGEEGLIEGSFGQSGKVKIRVIEGLKESTQQQLNALTKKKKGPESSETSPSGPVDQVKISLSYKAFIYSQGKAIFQTTV